jgi:hypothetical protein
MEENRNLPDLEDDHARQASKPRYAGRFRRAVGAPALHVACDPILEGDPVFAWVEVIAHMREAIARVTRRRMSYRGML